MRAKQRFLVGAGMVQVSFEPFLLTYPKLINTLLIIILSSVLVGDK